MTGSNLFVVLGAILGGLAVGAGAFGAHGLESYFGTKYADAKPKVVAGAEVPAAQKYLADFRTGVTYHMWHALGLIAVGLLARTQPSTSLTIAGWSFVVGILLFSGALYVLTIGGPRWLGVPWGLVAPFGGTAFLVGWVAFAIGAIGGTGRTTP